VLHQTEDTIIQTALMKLGDQSDGIRRIVTDLVLSGFKDVNELVELAGIARDSILCARQDWKPVARSTRCAGT
jgi:hypothetical protein